MIRSILVIMGCLSSAAISGFLGWNMVTAEGLDENLQLLVMICCFWMEVGFIDFALVILTVDVLKLPEVDGSWIDSYHGW